MFAVVFILIVIGILLYLFNKYVTKIDPRMKLIINWFVIICVVVWLLSIFGVFKAADIPVPQVR